MSQEGTGIEDMEDDDMDTTWIKWFCGIPGNEFFCEVDKAFIEDSFNLFGIKQVFPHDYNSALATILDRNDYDDDESSEDGQQQAAEMLYGMIHSRFLLTGQGLVAMHRKYQEKVFGECPRTCCNGQGVLPVGLSDDTALTPVKLFCPKCRDIYNCPNHRHMDGAYFGTTFAHMFLLTFENLVPTAPTHHYVPRVFGFKIHSSSACIPSDDHRPPDVVLGAVGTAATNTPSQPVATTSAGASSKRPRPVASDTTTTFPAVLGAAGDMGGGVGGVNSTGHQTLTPLPQSIAHQSSMTASNSNLLGLQSGGDSRFLAPTHHSHGHLGPVVNGGEKTDKSTSKDYFDEDEDDQDNGGGQQTTSTNHSHNNNSNSNSQPRTHHNHHGSSGVIVGEYAIEDHRGVASEAIVVEYIDRDEELSRKRRRKEDKHATINEDVEVLMSFDDTTAATAMVSMYPVSLDTGASVTTTTTHSTGKGRG